ncbi:hypothetical protein Pint_09866 [Pistacia integerrima]|uniref:Uncharacterized protein n=1 Tax=Pistacia integerrima TaxID=434235 RepID=A0ACC0XLX0_9ROSI|nr:hypothetical protein Pint_09866 [Pistacia integerrima]
MGSIAKNGLRQYLIQLQQHPLRTKAITAGVLSAISDIIAQKLTGTQKLQLRRLLLKVVSGFECSCGPFNWYFALRPAWFYTVTVVFGFAYLGPFGHFLHLVLDKIFKGKKDTKTVAKKVVLEQLTSSPLNNLLFMIYYGAVIEGRPWMHVKTKIKKEYPKVQYTAWTFWPVVGWVNHQYVPLQFRVIFHSAVAMCWYILCFPFDTLPLGIFLNLRARSMALPKAK